MPRESTTGTIYAGEFHRTMDAKNRVTVPSEWLGEEGEVFFILPAAENLSVMPEVELARQEEHLRSTLPVGKSLQAALRYIYSSARRVEPDKQGRILLPDELCKRAQLGSEVVFAGVRNRFEIWDAARWSTVAATGPETSEEVRKALEALGL